MGMATNLVMGYKAIMYGSIARNNLKTALWKINVVQGANDTESRAGHDVQLETRTPLKPHTGFYSWGVLLPAR
jgi:hypothetical protein